MHIVYSSDRHVHLGAYIDYIYLFIYYPDVIYRIIIITWVRCVLGDAVGYCGGFGIYRVAYYI